jgi:hypothetical protein
MPRRGRAVVSWLSRAIDRVRDDATRRRLGGTMRRIGSAVVVAACAAIAATVTLRAANLSGAIFTTVVDGTEVNYNIYPSKDAVYLDGGPGPGAPQGAAGLDDGRYVFQVTDPSGKVLLSTDPALCRQFDVANGIITNVVPAGSPACQHATGLDVDHGAATVQLIPYNDTPNPGGVYKVWVTMLADYQCAGNLAIVDCGVKKIGVAHGFVNRYSKTDNFKVNGAIKEIDTRFYDTSGTILDGRMITWIDTLGASNNKWSYEDLSHDIHHEAHVEDVENGTHQIVIGNQLGCAVGKVYANFVATKKIGPQTVSVSVNDRWSGDTFFIDVYCQ